MFKLLKILILKGVLLKGVAKIIKNETKEQKGGFLGWLLRASLFGNIVSGKGIVRAGYRNKEGKGMLRAGYGIKMEIKWIKLIFWTCIKCLKLLLKYLLKTVFVQWE